MRDLTRIAAIGSQGSSLPNPPSRDEILSVNLTFQGLVVNTQQYGQLPWFEAAIAWLNSSDRRAVYAAKSKAGDTHCIIQLPFGPPLYDEPNQPYSADRFGPLDWTNGGTSIDTRLTNLIREVATAGFKILLFLGGDGPDNADIAYKHLELLNANSDYRTTLYKYCVLIPGWDSVFYGWEPITKITNWGANFRLRWPDGHLGLEHNTGHIPLGEGLGDYSTTGRMKDFDLILSEYDQNLHQDNCWQINGRLEKPYHRPYDQPQGDDPAPPYYFQQQSTRGAFYHCAFEFGEYEYVRGGCSQDSINIVESNRQYLKDMGCRFTG